MAVFSRNASTGALTFVEMQKDGVGGVDGLNGAFGVTVSPDGSHFYAASQTDSAVAVFGTAVLSLTKTASSSAPAPGQVLTYTLVAANTGGADAPGALISDTLPAGLSLAGSISLEGGSGGAVGTIPILVSGVTISAGQRITVTFPVLVSDTLIIGTVITNTAAVSSADVTTSVEGAAVITLNQSIYLPIIQKN